LRGFRDSFGLTSGELTSIFVSLNKLRNACAHHNRVWNNSIDDCPTPKVAVCLRPTQQWVATDKKLASMYFIICHMLEALHPSKSIKFKQEFSQWVQQLCNTPQRQHYLARIGFAESVLTGLFV
jgi:abortive infection bacteriophage resistance protein